MDAHSIIHLIHESATDTDGWKSLPKEIAKYLNAKTVFLAAAPLGNLNATQSWTHDYSDDVWSDGPYSQIDQFCPQANPMILPIISSEIITPFERKEFIPDKEFSKNAFYRQAMIQQDLYYTCFSKLTHKNDTLSAIWFSPGSKKNIITDSQRHSFRMLLPHLSLAMTVREKFIALKADVQQYRTVSDRLAKAIFVVDGKSKIVYANQSAEILIDSNDGLTTVNQCLRILDTDLNNALFNYINYLSGPLTDICTALDETLYVPRPSGMPSYMMMLSPLIMSEPLKWPSSARVMITVANPLDEFHLPSRTQLQKIFNVTPAEARTMQLVPLGLSKPEIAEILGIKDATVKSHLDSVRRKLDADNLTELAQLIIRHQVPYR